MPFATGSLVKVVRGTSNSDLLPVGTISRVAVAIPADSGAADHKGSIRKSGVILDNGKYPFVWNESRFAAYTPAPENYATPSNGSPFASNDCCEESSCDD